MPPLPTGDLIGIDFENDEFIQKVLPRLPQEIRDLATDEVAKYLLNVLRAYPPYRKVTRESVYGQPFQSDRQRRWFFANLNSGDLQVPYQRTQGVSRGWEIIGSGERTILVNEAPGAQYAYGGNRLLSAIGWKRLAVMVEERKGKIQDIIKAAVKKAMRKR